MKKLSELPVQQPMQLLLVGSPGSGKTSLAIQFPRPAIADCDNNLIGPLRRLKLLNQFPELYVTNMNTDDKGETLPAHQRWTQFITRLDEMLRSPDVDTVIIDSLTAVNEYLLTHMMHVCKATTLEIQHWGQFKNQLSSFFMKLKTYGKHIIVIAHEVIERDKQGNVEKFTPMVSSSLKDYLGGYFSDVWRTEIRELPQNKYAYEIRMTGNSRYDLKNSFCQTGLTKNDMYELEKSIGLSKLLTPPKT